jgi:hypothetical protein
MDQTIWLTESDTLKYIVPTVTTPDTSDISALQGNLTALSTHIDGEKPYLNGILSNQTATSKIISDEHARLQEKQQSIANASAGIQRMTDINYNYQKRYWDYTKIVIIWTVILALYLILQILQSYFPFIPTSLIDLLILVAIIVGFIYSFWIYNNLLHYDPSYYGKISPKPPIKPGDGTLTNAQISAEGGLTSSTVAQATSCDGPSCCAYNGAYDVSGNLIQGSNTYWSYASHQCVAACPTGTSPGNEGICVSGAGGFSTLQINGKIDNIVTSANAKPLSPTEFSNYYPYN